MRYLAEASVARVLIEQLLLWVSGFGGELLDFGIDVPVADEDVGPAVVVEVKPAATPSQVLRVQAEPGLEGCVFEAPVALVVIEGRRVTGKVGLHDIEVAIEVVIGGSDSHAGLWLAVGAEDATSFETNFGEGTVLVVAVQH